MEIISNRVVLKPLTYWVPPIRVSFSLFYFIHNKHPKYFLLLFFRIGHFKRTNKLIFFCYGLDIAMDLALFSRILSYILVLTLTCLRNLSFYFLTFSHVGTILEGAKPILQFDFSSDMDFPFLKRKSTAIIIPQSNLIWLVVRWPIT